MYSAESTTCLAVGQPRQSACLSSPPERPSSVNVLIIFNSPINGRQYKNNTEKKKKAVTIVTKHIDLTAQYQTQAMTIYDTDLRNALSHALYLIKKMFAVTG